MVMVRTKSNDILLDIIVTRRDDDPIGYRSAINHPLCRLIEVPFVPEGIIKCRQNLSLHGVAPYIMWFDPDDILYNGAIDIIISHLEMYPTITAVMMTSDIHNPRSAQTTITINEFEQSPVNGHFLRAVRRDWLVEHLDDFDWPVAEWVFTANLIQTNAIIIQTPGYKWIARSHSAVHTTLSRQDIDDTRTEVSRIMGYKYDYITRLKRPHGY